MRPEVLSERQVPGDAEATAAARLGISPAQFGSASDKAGLDALCRFAAEAYFDNPLPAVFKERAFVRLSQAAGVRYCLIRHVSRLIGNGFPAGDRHAAPDEPGAVIVLLTRGFVDEDGVDRLVGAIDGCGRLADLPTPGSAAEGLLIDALACVFAHPGAAVRIAEALTAAIGAEHYAQMVALLSYVRAEHFWALAHPELSFADDLVLIAQRSPALAGMIDAAAAGSGASVDSSAPRLRGNDELQRLLDYTAFGIMALTRDGVLIEANDRLLAKIGHTRDDLRTGALNWVDVIAPDHREEARQHLTAFAATGRVGPFETQFVLPDGARRWVLIAGRELVDGTLVAFAIDVDAGKRAEAALGESEARYRALVEGIPQLVWRAIDGGEWTWSSSQWSEFTGLSARDSLGFGWEAALHPSDRATARAFWQTAELTGRLEMESRILHAATGEYRWFATRATPVRDEAGAIIEWLGTSTDVHDMRMMQERYVRLAAELQHRARNILSVIRSVFARTAEVTGDRSDVIDHFRGRLDALARTQVTVTRHADGFADLDTLVRDELIGVGLGDAERVSINGPDVSLPLAIAESMGLTIHELTTNALKFGALKGSGGSVDIRWRVEVDHAGSRLLDFTWSERGVAAVSTDPSRDGFGRELIEEALPQRHGATTSLVFRGGGIHCSIRMPLPVDV
ncbi:sensor histidine kinase [Sphingomonas sp. Mn802worker]|uniref:sensor histidine kinase n=1 Tax=Sphingomonas sp. Mn802worker TaxID=629773 RepID=UPI00037FB32F|nr:PAS domain S-box protein [Sphingomonas sp. Mn802worker]